MFVPELRGDDTVSPISGCLLFGYAVLASVGAAPALVVL